MNDVMTFSKLVNSKYVLYTLYTRLRYDSKNNINTEGVTTYIYMTNNKS